MQNNFYGQLVIVTKDLEARERVAARLRDRLRKDYVGISTYVQPLEMGPPVGRPIQYRVSGPQIDKVREYAMGLAGVLDGNPNIGDIVYDWNEPGKMLKIDIAQDKARQLGLSSEDVAQIMNSVVTGSAVTQVRDDIYLVNVIGRAEDSERGSLETLESLQIVTPSGTSIPPQGVRQGQLRAGAAAGVAPRPQADDHGEGVAARRDPAHRPGRAGWRRRSSASLTACRRTTGSKWAARWRRAARPRARSPRWCR